MKEQDEIIRSFDFSAAPLKLKTFKPLPIEQYVAEEIDYSKHVYQVSEDNITWRKATAHEVYEIFNGEAPKGEELEKCNELQKQGKQFK